MLADQPHLHQKRDRLKQLRVFCQAARLGSVSQAAEQVMSSQPAVSVQVRALEAELGMLLFERHGPRISLTRVGETLYRLAMPLVAGLDRLPDTFAEQHHGMVSDVLHIGAGETSAAYLLPRYLERFRGLYTEVRVDVRTGTSRERLNWLRDYELDLVVAATDFPPPDVEFVPLIRSEFVLITPEDHPLAGRDAVAFEELAAYPFVGHTPTHHVRQAGEVIMRYHGLVPDIVVAADGWETIIGYVAAGVGISFVPDLCLGDHDSLGTIPFTGIFRPRRYGAITRRDGLIGLAASRFLRIVTAVPPEASGES